MTEIYFLGFSFRGIRDIGKRELRDSARVPRTAMRTSSRAAHCRGHARHHSTSRRHHERVRRDARCARCESGFAMSGVTRARRCRRDAFRARDFVAFCSTCAPRRGCYEPFLPAPLFTRTADAVCPMPGLRRAPDSDFDAAALMRAIAAYLRRRAAAASAHSLPSEKHCHAMTLYAPRRDEVAMYR